MLQEKKHMGLEFNARALQWTALLLMLIDHIGNAFFRNDPWIFFCLKGVGRMAFPIFAFQIAEGCIHTSNLKRYMLRLFAFGVISEIPFNMMHSGLWPLDPQHQNVMFTLLLGLVSLHLLLRAKEKKTMDKCVAILVFLATYVIADLCMLDYGGIGVATVVMFGLSRDLKASRIIQTVCLALLSFAMVLTRGTLQLPLQMLAVLAMIPIGLYNGKPGKKNKILQYCAYLFYPAHISVLVILRYLVVKLG